MRRKRTKKEEKRTNNDNGDKVDCKKVFSVIK